MQKLREYQVNISNKANQLLVEKKYVYLSLQVRVGKTLIALETCKKHGSKKVLFITKKKAFNSIKNDYNSFGYDFYLEIINKESIHKINDNDFDIIICDEAHSLFGTFPKANNFTKYYKKTYNKIPVIMLSGTLSPESFSQIFHQFWINDYSPFKEYKNFYKWANDYVNVKQIMIAGNRINDYSGAIIEKVEKAIEPYLITFTQTDAGFETQITETIHYVEMLPITYNICNKLKKDNVIVGKEQTILADTPVKLLSKLHQLYSGTIKFEDGTAKTIDSSKVQFIKNYFKGKKIAIFYKFKQELEMIKQLFQTTDSPEEFNANDNLTFAGQFVSSREGVNLSSADCLVMINIDFSALSYLQARDRMTTKDRTKENAVHWIFAEKGIEKDIYKTVKNKESYTTQHFKKLCS